jgi:hypothetical protein
VHGVLKNRNKFLLMSEISLPSVCDERPLPESGGKAPEPLERIRRGQAANRPTFLPQSPETLPEFFWEYI